MEKEWTDLDQFDRLCTRPCADRWLSLFYFLPSAREQKNEGTGEES